MIRNDNGRAFEPGRLHRIARKDYLWTISEPQENTYGVYDNHDNAFHEQFKNDVFLLVIFRHVLHKFYQSPEGALQNGFSEILFSNGIFWNRRKGQITLGMNHSVHLHHAVKSNKDSTAFGFRHGHFQLITRDYRLDKLESINF